MLECTLCAGQTPLHRCGRCIQERGTIQIQHPYNILPKKVWRHFVSSSLGRRVIHSLETLAAVLCATVMAQPPYDPLIRGS